MTSLLLLGACAGGEPAVPENAGDTGTGTVIYDLTGGPAAGEISITDGEFSTDRITYKAGEAAVLRILAVQGSYGIAAGDLGINVTVAAGQALEVTVPTDRAGEFDLACTAGCGDGGVKAAIVIEE